MTIADRNAIVAEEEIDKLTVRNRILNERLLRIRREVESFILVSGRPYNFDEANNTLRKIHDIATYYD